MASSLRPQAPAAVNLKSGAPLASEPYRRRHGATAIASLSAASCRAGNAHRHPETSDRCEPLAIAALCGRLAMDHAIDGNLKFMFTASGQLEVAGAQAKAATFHRCGKQAAGVSGPVTRAAD